MTMQHVPIKAVAIAASLSPSEEVRIALRAVLFAAEKMAEPLFVLDRDIDPPKLYLADVAPFEINVDQIWGNG